jgi:uncharacterized protein YbaR (Trm112 family)
MLGRLLGGVSDESRAYSPTAMWLAGSMVPVTTKSGVSVSQETAFKVNAVYAAVRLIADSIAMLPVDTFYRAGGERRPYRPKPDWIENPDADGGTRQSFLTQWLASKLTAQAACIRILRDGTGDVLAFSALDPRLLEILVCPVTHGPLEYDRAAGELISRKANLAYPVRDGVPVMLPEEARAL